MPSSPGRAAILSAALLASATTSGAVRAQPAPDASMTCPQIGDALSAQNAIIKDADQKKAELVAAPPDPGAADPAIGERLADIRADKATKKANALVALGRAKSCFR